MKTNKKNKIYFLKFSKYYQKYPSLLTNSLRINYLENFVVGW